MVSESGAQESVQKELLTALSRAKVNILELGAWNSHLLSDTLSLMAAFRIGDWYCFNSGRNATVTAVHSGIIQQ
jgi:hypothetical protein